MKMNHWLVGVAAGITLSTSIAAEDFSAYSNEELQQKRTEVRNMSEADREAFRSEMQTRMKSMSDEERAQFRSNAGGGGGGGGKGQGQGQGGGSGRMGR